MDSYTYSGIGSINRIKFKNVNIFATYVAITTAHGVVAVVSEMSLNNKLSWHVLDYIECHFQSSVTGICI